MRAVFLLEAVRSSRKAMAGAAVLAVFTLAAVFAGVIAPANPNAQDFTPMESPSLQHLLGTTANGQDVFSQLVYGTRQSLLIAAVAGLAATVLSVLIGVSAAYLSGISDHLLSLLTDVFLVIPALPLAIVLAAYAKGGGVATLVIVIAVTGWSFGARQLRSQALSLRDREFLEAARVRGERIPYVIVFGDKESDKALAVRKRGGVQSTLSLEGLRADIKKVATL